MHNSKAAHPIPGSADLCFLSDATLNEWKSHLADRGVPIETDPARRNGATGPIRSIHLRDPDGNLVEIANSV